MKVIILTILGVSMSLIGFTQVLNNSCSTAKKLLTQADELNYCSGDTEYTTVGSSTGEVWFTFIAHRSDVNITAIGPVNGSAATLLVPTILLFQDCGNGIYSSVTHTGNLSTLYKGGLIIGERYYFRISGSNTGTFKLCLNNYTPVLRVGQDCGTASFLCNKQLFTQTNVTGAGANVNEAAGTCMASPGVNSEQNSVWYKWIAANDGSLTFTITPSSRDDIDWVLFDLGTSDDCSKVRPANAIRCAAGRGVDCDPRTQHVYTITGMSLTDTDISEGPGCADGQNGFVKYVDMIQGHIYGLLINNFDSSGHGFTIEFGGTGEFVGPNAKLNFVENTTCPLDPSYTFISLSTHYSNLKWTFGEGASISTTTGEGPFTVSYATSGLKTAVLEALNDRGCEVIDTKVVTALAKPLPPVIDGGKMQYCLGDTIRLYTPMRSNMSFQWTGPNGFTSSKDSVVIPVDAGNRAGVYSLVAAMGDYCKSATASFTVPPVSEKPRADFNSKSLSESSNLQLIQFLNTSTGADHYLWDFGDGNSSSEVNPTHVYTSAGLFAVYLHAFASGSCPDEAVAHTALFIGKDGTIRNHSAFTPNGDSINDEFVVNVTDLKSYKIRIFDRYGVLLFTSSDYADNWTGLYQGNPLPVGVYYYVIDGLGLNGKEISKSGSVTILK